MVNTIAYLSTKEQLSTKNVRLVAVSKLKPASDIRTMYDLGQRDFGENYVQELVEKAAKLPEDIQWHFIGHLQTNKVKYIASFVHLVHGVDSLKLLQEINKQGRKNGRVIDCLLQVHIATEESKFGFDSTDLVKFGAYFEANKGEFSNVRIRGMMGMASFSENETQLRKEFSELKQLFEIQKGSTFLFDEHFDTLSMGMSGDYELAVEEGSNMVRIGSLLFGRRG